MESECFYTDLWEPRDLGRYIKSKNVQKDGQTLSWNVWEVIGPNDRAVSAVEDYTIVVFSR